MSSLYNVGVCGAHSLPARGVIREERDQSQLPGEHGSQGLPLMHQREAQEEWMLIHALLILFLGCDVSFVFFVRF